MIATNESIKILKERFHNPAVADTEKKTILEFFQEHNDIFNSNLDIDLFYNQLMELLGNKN